MHRVLLYSVITLSALAAASGVLAENALHVWNHDPANSTAANAIAQQGASTWQPLQITAHDGARLDAWLFTPRKPNGAAVILMHGIADTRMGMSAHAPFLLRAGYTVLLPDSRAHGASGGAIVTYGVREAGDIHLWADTLLRCRHVQRLYGLGQSMGAAILLESIPQESRFRALVTDFSFATFEEIAYDRLTQAGIPNRTIAWPLLHLGFAYARVRYGVNLSEASPAAAIRTAHIPVLLIHGADDENIPVRHSRELHTLNPTATQLWEVPHAGHVSSLATQPDEYQRQVLAWFTQH
jgi:alpha-beta hydrolase superfamily lysophospholipase